MGPADRRREIADLVRTLGHVDTSELTDRFGVNAETIRRDLVFLERSGTVQRTHGGAVARSALAPEGRVSARLGERREDKLAIAREAVAEIPDFGVVFIEAGSTTGRLCDVLPDRSDLLIITNALQTALRLADHGGSTVMTVGGRVRPESYAEVDTWAVDRFESLRFDVAFVGANAVDLEWGLSTPDPAEAAVKAAILRSAQTAVLLVDHTKFGTQAACRYADVDAVDVVITDPSLSENTRTDLTALGINVRIANPATTDGVRP